jgi:outer membrane protein, multidrug efflux system
MIDARRNGRRVIQRGLLSLSLALAGCWKVGPDYEKPVFTTPKNWRFAAKAARDVSNIEWWRLLGDPVLNRLVDEAVLNNLDIKIAVANVEQFMGRYGSTRANLFPQIFGTALYERRLISGAESGTVNDLPFEDRDHAVLGGQMNWEVDVWGQLRRAKEAANADLFAQVAARDAVVLTVAALAAQTYVNLRALDVTLEATRGIIETLTEEQRIAKTRMDMGYSSEIEFTQSRSELERRKALAPLFEQRIAEAEHALSVLLGKNPGPIPRGQPLYELLPPAVPAGLPADLLRRRPDIQQAEHNLVAANARIGVARGEYFPKVMLTAMGGQAAQNLDQMFMPGATFWSVGMQLIGPIFTAGKIAGQVQAAEAVQRAALAAYQKATITAFREFEDALIAGQKARERQIDQEQRVAAVKSYVHLSRLQFDEGYTPYLVVLDSLRQLYDAEIDLITARNDTLVAAIQLYRAMGGGWVAGAQRKAETPRPREASIFP